MKHSYTLFRRKGQKVWYFHYYEGNIRKAKSTGKTKKYEAEIAAQEFLSRDEKRDVTLAEYAHAFFDWEKCDWIKRQHAKGRPFSRGIANMRRGQLKGYILPRFGKKKLSNINRVDIEKWLIGLPLANQTRNHLLYTFRIILREAELEGYLERNPLEKVEAMGNDSKPRDVFRLDELKLLFPEDRDELTEIWKNAEYACAFMILATTGIRSGELRALQWKHVLWEGGLIIEQAVKGDMSIGKTKTSAVRVVVLTERAKDLIASWREQSPYDREEHFIFFGKSGDRPLTNSTLPSMFKKALVRAGVEVNGRNLVVHSFRHTFNTLMRRVLPIDTLQALTGHKSGKMTDLYDHPTVEDRLRVLMGSQKLIESVWN